MNRLLACGIVAALAFLVGGCAKSKIHFEKTEKVPASSTKTYTVEGPKSTQKVKVEVTTNEPVNASVYLEKDVMKPLGEKAGVKEATFEVEIPANEVFTVAIITSKETEVTVKINNN